MYNFYVIRLIDLVVRILINYTDTITIMVKKR